MSTLRVNNVAEAGGAPVITSGVLDSGSLPTGSVLQVVRATDSTLRTTTSTSAVDANISVTITPKRASSQIIVVWSAFASPTGGTENGQNMLITDTSNVALSGAERVLVGSNGLATEYNQVTAIGVVSPATTSAVTYKGRFWVNVSGSQSRIFNNLNTGQMFAIEVAV